MSIQPSLVLMRQRKGGRAEARRADRLGPKPSKQVRWHGDSTASPKKDGQARRPKVRVRVPLPPPLRQQATPRARPPRRVRRGVEADGADGVDAHGGDGVEAGERCSGHCDS